MSKRLEDFIRYNKEDFDSLEPRADLWNNIEKGLQLPVKEKKTFTLGFVMRVAATVILVMGVTFILYLRYQNANGKSIDLAGINPVYAKQQVHYASLVESKLTELKMVTKSDPQLYKEFSAEIAKMDSTYKRLNADLANSPNQELVLRAMIRNLQAQTDVLNQQLTVVEQFNQYKKDENHGIKNI